MEIFVAIWSKKSISTEGLEFRISELQAAIASAWEKFQAAKVSGANPIQAIFMAPEYLMSAPRANFVDAKALLEDDRDILVQEIRRISQNLPGMMLVPGTIAFEKELERPNSQKRKMNPETGGRTGPLKTVSREDKALKSFDSFWNQLDYAKKAGINVPGSSMEQVSDRKAKFLCEVNLSKGPLISFDAPKIFKNNVYVFLNGKIVHKYSKQADWFETLGAPGVHFIPGGSSCTKKIGDILFGFEICMDHSMHVLGNSLAVYKARNMNALAQPPDIHILLSDETGNQYFPMRDGGFMLHASTNQSVSTVFFKDKSGKVPITSDDIPKARQFLSEDQIGGSRMTYWKINLV